MMKLQRLAMLAMLALPVLAIAGHHEGERQTRIVIQTEGELDAPKLAELMRQVHADIGTDGDMEVHVLVDDEDNVQVRKERAMPSSRGEQGLHKIKMAHGMQGMQRMQGMHGMNHGMDMPPAVAKCILKNLGKVNADAAAMLLHRACMALEVGEDPRDR